MHVNVIVAQRCSGAVWLQTNFKCPNAFGEKTITVLDVAGVGSHGRGKNDQRRARV